MISKKIFLCEASGSRGSGSASKAASTPSGVTVKRVIDSPVCPSLHHASIGPKNWLASSSEHVGRKGAQHARVVVAKQHPPAPLDPHAEEAPEVTSHLAHLRAAREEDPPRAPPRAGHEVGPHRGVVEGDEEGRDVEELLRLPAVVEARRGGPALAHPREHLLVARRVEDRVERGGFTAEPIEDEVLSRRHGRYAVHAPPR
jgi:hypothetical protein